VTIATLAVLCWLGFTVDDALISARYASHIKEGLGHRFNPSGPITDGVTPLPWPYILAPFASDAMSALVASRIMGVVAWLVVSLLLAIHLSKIVGRRLSLGHLAWPIAFATPCVAAWASAGMETSIATALTTAAVVASGVGKRRLAGLALGIGCTLRPELLPFALTIALGSAWLDAPGYDEATFRKVRALMLHVPLVVGPFVVVALLRLWLFGAPGPLALRAKPSDLTHGLQYAVAVWLVVGTPIAVLAPIAWRKLNAWAKWLVAAWIVHTLSCVIVGGDWMPLSRLFVPVLPSLAVVFAHLARVAHPASTIARAVVCVAGHVFVTTSVMSSARRVMSDRSVLVEQLRDTARDGDVIASVDVGWVGAAHRGVVVDLAGVTDPVVASLPGGHTSKRILPEMLELRGVTHLLMLVRSAGRDSSRLSDQEVSGEQAWEECLMSRRVEVDLCRSKDVRSVFKPAGTVEATESLRYVVLKRCDERID